MAVILIGNAIELANSIRFGSRWHNITQFIVIAIGPVTLNIKQFNFQTKKPEAWLPHVRHGRKMAAKMATKIDVKSEGSEQKADILQTIFFNTFAEW